MDNGTRRRGLLMGVAVAVAAMTGLTGGGFAAAEVPTPTASPDAVRTATTAPSPTATAAPSETAAPSPSAVPTADPTPSGSPTVPDAAGSGAGRASTDTSDPWARSPYMGWSSYSMQVLKGGSWMTGDQLMAQSDAMHAKLQSFGYKYINIDAGWNGGFDEYGRPTPSTKVFPDGMQKVIDHIHHNGQKVGIYMIPGIGDDLYQADRPILGAPGCTTRQIAAQPLQQGDYWGYTHKIDFSNPCAQKWIDSIADRLARWGIDFVKLDSVTPGSGIYDGSIDSRGDVSAWSTALKSRKIWLEISWAVDINQADFWRQKADGWRVEWDVECYCGDEALTAWPNIERLFPRAADWWRYAGDGGWNDFDSLDVGNGSMDGLTKDERQTATTLWAMSAAPLYTGNDMTDLDSYGLSLLTNPEVIAVDQAGTPARPVSTDTQQQVWYALQADGSYTVALFNLGRTDKDVRVNWSDIGLTGPATVRDLWRHKDLTTSSSGYTARTLPIHGSRLLKVTPTGGNTVSVNDDALRVAYSGNWTRNDNREIAATSQPLAVTVTSTGVPTPPSGAGSVVSRSLNDDDTALAYSGSWSQSTNRGLGDYGDDVHYTERDGDSVQLTFQGTGVSMLTELDESQGKVDIYLDGTLQKTVDTSLPSGQTRKTQQVVYSASGLTDGTHVLRAVKASGQFMLVDRIDVQQPNLISPNSVGFDTKAPADVTVELARDGGEVAGVSRAGAALRSGRDYTVSGSRLTVRAAYLATLPAGTSSLDVAFRGDYLGDVHWTAVDGDSVSYRFHGTGVDWVTPTAPDQGKVTVYVDGRRIATVDTRSGTRRTGQKRFGIDGLQSGDHTLKLVKADGDVMRNDVIRYSVG